MAQLIASAGSRERIAAMIGDYFYSKEPFVLAGLDDRTFSVVYPATSAKAGKILENYQVVIARGRYRFELIRKAK